MKEKENTIKQFHRLEPLLVKKAGGDVHLIQKIGSRWSYIDGPITEASSKNIPIRLTISENWALVCYASSPEKLQISEIQEMFKVNE